MPFEVLAEVEGYDGRAQSQRPSDFAGFQAPRRHQREIGDRIPYAVKAGEECRAAVVLHEAVEIVRCRCEVSFLAE